ncbi:hypothetical protein GLYMA_17G171250v4 [Glycine max]|uniref:Uncharacterized protein n=1 Tax=Glycine soja TaxID=3848 RepID=A0A445G7W0_GLYSO|nr:uncharacterized protein LOC114392707 [Glycine soja]KAG4379073.1 hypothetical protein GLYMA_17G171250v4 [Glycine max]KAG4379074.1 hypothetical protein GLYMA_17G171250v4 [Glycine max]KAH1118831.1 hypothetical protein GYH30_047566 [Glycine max]KAH1118832.1 hypothetical protein GYH30_047566 [Glycine max]KAH1202632.1 hypothetical protein GmHk_17G049058 [Glycine max]|eukprot:XP_006600951.1 uncharacterized protein LOC102665790 [Glycine max]
MNPEGAQANANNQNEVILHLSLDLESLSLLPLFPVAESVQRFNEGLLPQPQMNLHNGPKTVVPLHEFSNVALRSNISPSSSLAKTPQKPSTNLDLSLASGLGMNPNNNLAQGHAVQEQGMRRGTLTNIVHLRTKRRFSDCVFQEFQVGESSKMGEQAALAKRRATRF